MFIRGINAVYAQARTIEDHQVKAFAFFCHALLQLIHMHHSIEDEFVFPFYESKMGDPNVHAMRNNIEEHLDFQEGLKDLQDYIQEVQDGKAVYNGELVIKKLDSFTDKLVKHLHDEIPTIESSRLREAITEKEMKDLEGLLGREILKRVSLTTTVPLTLILHDKTTAPEFPPMPTPVLWLTQNVLWHFHSDAWAFAPCDVYGKVKAGFGDLTIESNDVEAIALCDLTCDTNKFKIIFWATSLSTHDGQRTMANPQHYQPLSHALNPPQGHQATYTGMFSSKVPTTATTTQRSHREEEEEEEEEEDGDDEGVVEEQLSRHDTDNPSNPSSPRTKSSRTADAAHQEDSQNGKRRPGRPRGSKNRKPRSGTASKQEPTFYNPPSTSTPPQHPDVNAHNQQYYEFQWRVLNLCSEFYTAAEELVKATQPLVIAQCYQMGPGSKVDPLSMLNEAKRICDTLLSNPSQLVASPPPPIYHPAPALYQPMQIQSAPSTSVSRPPPSANSAPASSTVITNPASFVMPLPSAQANYAQYQMYPPHGQYPTTPYYQYPYGGYYPQPPAAASSTIPAPSQPQPVPTAQPEASTSSGINVSAANVITSSAGAGGNQGAWSDEETEKLKKMAEENKTQSGEIDWDRVVGQWGISRTRHQILIKATSLGLKESSSRGVKRRRDEGAGDAPNSSVAHTPTVATATTTAPTATVTTASTSNQPAPSSSHSSTPAASPALQNQQRPATKPSSLPWPMPTVAAVNAPSPVIATSTSQDPTRTSYYRPRPETVKSSSSSSSTAHPYMYQPNGSAGSSRLGKENGK
ncbi:hypothetical protein H0H93_001486 [Arthromyces matolae]|nr:hypothetical protein H0H93_001486 [Arthromyces matolae]